MRPLLLVDVDGPLNPYAAKPTRRPNGYTTHRLAPNGCDPRKPYRVWLHPDHGRMLLDTAHQAELQLVWCTTWEHEANRMIGPRIGLPELPVINLPSLEYKSGTARWKFDAALEFAAQHPLAWLDDQFNDYPTRRDWFLQQRGTTPTLLHHVNPRVGLTQPDLDHIAQWAATL